jgi:hypothetical protein
MTSRAVLRSFMLASPLLGLSLGVGCDNGASGMPPAGTLGVPDVAHGVSTDGDIDGDGVGNEMDNCPSLANADQRSVCSYARMPPAATGDVVDDAVARLNFFRTQLGLDPVTADATQTRGCEVHVAYLQSAARVMGRPVLSHEEDPAIPGYSEEGNEAGINSVLSLGEPTSADAINGWLDTLYHRLPLIDPGLRTVGVAYADGIACVQYRPGTMNSVTSAHPILWPIADGRDTNPIFGGSESPCPTVEDPLSGGACPGSAAIVSVGIHDARSIANVTGTLRRIDTGEEQPLFHIWHAGGDSPHERMGYLQNTISLVPEVGSMLANAPYEANIQATVDGAPQTYRWRFGFRNALDPMDNPLDQSIQCEVWQQASFERAISTSGGLVNGKVCATPDFFRLSRAGNYRVQVAFDPGVGQIDVFVYDAGQNRIDASESSSGVHTFPSLSGMSYIEIRGRNGGMGAYRLNVEALR